MSTYSERQTRAIVFPAVKTFVLLMVVITILAIAGLLAFWTTRLSFENYWLTEACESLFRLFDTNAEANVPSWYSSIALFVAAALLGFIAKFIAPLNPGFQPHWRFLAFLFLFLSADEAALFHEMLSKPIRAALGTDGLLYYPWVIVGTVVFVLTGVGLARFLLHLPAKTRWSFVLAGSIFVGGAIVMESISTYFETVYSTASFAFRVLMAIEEFCEMAGVAIFIYALMVYINENYTITLACLEKSEQ